MISPPESQMLMLQGGDELIQDYTGAPRWIDTPEYYKYTSAAERVYTSYFSVQRGKAVGVQLSFGYISKPVSRSEDGSRWSSCASL